MMKCPCLLIPIMRLGETYGKILNNPARDDSRERGKGTFVYCAKSETFTAI